MNKKDCEDIRDEEVDTNTIEADKPLPLVDPFEVSGLIGVVRMLMVTCRYS